MSPNFSLTSFKASAVLGWKAAISDLTAITRIKMGRYVMKISVQAPPSMENKSPSAHAAFLKINTKYSFYCIYYVMLFKTRKNLIRAENGQENLAFSKFFSHVYK